ncbi:MAG: stage 0 sporulation family protein [Lawsonibacter sp.]|jgi:cell fate regulator YaaT (PSP1 superfamily)|nr:stage 0 sporulation family protein [Lawsonibacter sp.]
MVEIISIRFKSGGKEYYFNPNGIQFQVGDGVIVETARGTEYAQCVRSNNMVDEIDLTAPLRPVVRKATQEDARLMERNKDREKHAFSVCQAKILEHGLDMKLVSAEYSFDGSKILFFFTSEGRVDFRALVKDLAGALHTRIELRQIGVRDEAKLLGGLGICGKPFCCSQFLDDFQPVSIKMAKTQNLSLNPTKISGTCGRLMCCLKYEQEAYEDLVKKAPKQESFVETPDGAGTVSSVNLLRQTVQVRLESDPDSPRCYHNCELCVIRSGKGKRPEGYVEPPLEELAKLRRQDAGASAPVTEEASLAAAIEAAFPSRERKQPAPHEEREERQPNHRRRRPKGEGGEQRPPREGAPESGGKEERQDSKPREEGGEFRPNRRRRRRPRGGGGKPSSPQQ